MSELYGDEAEQKPNILTHSSANATEIRRSYQERLSNAEAEYNIVKQEAEGSADKSVWKHLEEKWQKEFSNLRAELSREVARREEELDNEITAFESSLQSKPAEWEHLPENWNKLEGWRRELQALRDCDKMMERSL